MIHGCFIFYVLDDEITGQWNNIVPISNVWSAFNVRSPGGLIIQAAC